MKLKRLLVASGVEKMVDSVATARATGSSGVDGEVPEKEIPTSVLDDEQRYARFKKWFTEDAEHFDKWRKSAIEDYDFYSGKQWTDEQISEMEEFKRPSAVFNLIEAMIDSVCGFEVANRQEVRYIPRQEGQSAVNQLLTSAAHWFRDQTNAEDEDSDAFKDCAITGVGCTETFIDYESNPDGDPVTTRIDPLEAFPDKDARKPNYDDKKRVWRIRKYSVDEAQAMFPEADVRDLDASWATDRNSEVRGVNDPLDDYDGHEDRPQNRPDCTIVECQFIEREPFMRYVDSQTGEEVVMSEKQFTTLVDRLEKIPPETLLLQGISIPKGAIKQYRKVFRRVFLGRVILNPDNEALPAPNTFTYNFITGKRDRNKGTFYGLVRAMKDPQRWTNKLFAQIIHILNSNAKGGLLAERGAFENDRDAQKDYAKADSIVFTNPGAIRDQRIMAKPQAGFPQGQAEMLQFAMGSMPRVTGINLEFLGMRDANQPGVLEMQRREAGVTILATLFDNLRRYRKAQGKLMLALIQRYLSDDRLVKVSDDPSNVQFLPLNRTSTLGEYEVIIDDAPQSPNSKERNWSVIERLWPIIQPMVMENKAIASKIVRSSPLPEGLATEMIEILQTPPPQPTPEQLEAQAIAKASAIADVDKTAAQAEKYRSDAQATQAETIHEFMAALATGMVNPDLPMTPVPTGLLPGMDIPIGSATPHGNAGMPLPGQPRGPGALPSLAFSGPQLPMMPNTPQMGQ